MFLTTVSFILKHELTVGFSCTQKIDPVNITSNGGEAEEERKTRINNDNDATLS